jgi:hypothetical protein
VTRARRWGIGAIGALTAAIVAPGCRDEVDPLDPEVLAELARSRGDAQGIDRSGIYVGTFEVLHCGCGEIDTPYDVSLCTAAENLPFGAPPLLQLELVQADGSVRIQALALGDFFESEAVLLPVFYGPLQADGRLSAGGVLQADALLVQGQVLGRIDGISEFDDELGWGLVVEYQQRYAIELLADPGVLDIGLDVESQSVDCRERVGLDLRWVSPPFGPVGR